MQSLWFICVVCLHVQDKKKRERAKKKKEMGLHNVILSWYDSLSKLSDRRIGERRKKKEMNGQLLEGREREVVRLVKG